MTLAVVKLGGSSTFEPELRLWTEALAASGRPLVVVPGGGPFADQVRHAQKRVGFSDRAAHNMAILAMDQFGCILLDMSERFSPARTTDQISRALDRDQIPVWLPSSMVIGRKDIAASWDVTSDSLASWLAGQLGAGALLLIKQTRDISGGDRLSDLAKRGIVDPMLASTLPADIDLYIAGPKDVPTARGLLAAGSLPGVRIGLPASVEQSG